MQEPMTDYQLETMLKMLLEIIKGCDSIDEATAKIKDLIRREEQKLQYKKEVGLDRLTSQNRLFGGGC